MVIELHFGNTAILALLAVAATLLSLLSALLTSKEWKSDFITVWFNLVSVANGIGAMIFAVMAVKWWLDI